MALVPYHHGDLRAALLREAEAELAENGVEGFSLRGVAKRAGVSHAAPAHHFGDAGGLLSALAAEGFRRFVAAQERRMEGAAGGRERMLGLGLGYLDFALASPALFRLMFGSNRPDKSDPALAAAAAKAFGLLVSGVAALRGGEPETGPEARTDLIAAWAMVHGLAELTISGGLCGLEAEGEAEREAAFRAILARSLPPE